MRRALFLVVARRPARVEEALRAALGASLRGGAVTVWLAATGARTPLARRALGVLQTFGHAVSEGGGRAALDEADAVEVWTEAGGEREAEAGAEVEAEATPPAASAGAQDLEAGPAQETDGETDDETDGETDGDPETDGGTSPLGGRRAQPQAPSDAGPLPDSDAHPVGVDGPASFVQAAAEPLPAHLPTLHLLREGARVPAALLGGRDWLVTLGGAPRLHRHGAPPLPPGPLSFDELHRLLGLAARVVTW